MQINVAALTDAQHDQLAALHVGDRLPDGIPMTNAPLVELSPKTIAAFMEMAKDGAMVTESSYGAASTLLEDDLARRNK